MNSEGHRNGRARRRAIRALFVDHYGLQYTNKRSKSKDALGSILAGFQQSLSVLCGIQVLNVFKSGNILLPQIWTVGFLFGPFLGGLANPSFQFLDVHDLCIDECQRPSNFAPSTSSAKFEHEIWKAVIRHQQLSSPASPFLVVAGRLRLS